ncbi:MAG: V-type ATP synthase subunit F [Candidatus Methanomethylicus sp.]|nr:V-type ATP synthase subunit F [Candidatus Methanomethylicus sp.]
MKIVFIGDPLLVDGYGISGIESMPVNSPEEFSKTLDSIINREDIGIILLDYDYSSQAKEKVDMIKLKKELPVLVEVPGRRSSADVDLKATISKIMGVKM